MAHTSSCGGTQADLVADVVAAIRAVVPRAPDVAIVCGSGLSDLYKLLSDTTTIPYDKVPHFAVSTGAPRATPRRLPRQLVRRTAARPMCGARRCARRGRVRQIKSNQIRYANSRVGQCTRRSVSSCSARSAGSSWRSWCAAHNALCFCAAAVPTALARRAQRGRFHYYEGYDPKDVRARARARARAARAR